MTVPVIVLVTGGGSSDYAAVFRAGLSKTGYIDGRNVTVEYRGLEGQLDRLPARAGIVRQAVQRRARTSNRTHAAPTRLERTQAWTGLRMPGAAFAPVVREPLSSRVPAE
jgi:hypothetical protein